MQYYPLKPSRKPYKSKIIGKNERIRAPNFDPRLSLCPHCGSRIPRDSSMCPFCLKWF